jgi:hypothetical protein
MKKVVSLLEKTLAVAKDVQVLQEKNIKMAENNNNFALS